MSVGLICSLDPAIDKLKEFSDFIGISNFAEDKRETARKERAAKESARIEALRKQREQAFNQQQSQFDREIALAEAQGKSTVELTKQKIQGSIAFQKEKLKEIQLEIKARELTADLLGDIALANIQREQIAEANKKIIEINESIADSENQLKINVINNNKAKAASYQTYAKDVENSQRQIEDLQNQLLEDGLEKELLLNKQKFERQREDITATGQQRLELIELFNQLELQKENEIQEKFRQQRLDNFTSEIETLQLVEDAKTEVSLKGAEKRADGEKKISKELADYRVSVATQSLSAISDIAELFSKGNEKQAKRAFQIQKAVGIAQATINTAQAITKVFAETTDFTPTQSLRIANAVAIGVAGAAQIASIASQQFQGGGGGETPSVDTSGGGQAQAPSFNVVGDSGVNQLAQIQQQPVQAFVVSGEVTTSQALDRNRVQNATL